MNAQQKHEEKKTRFLKVYVGLPINIRKDIILNIENIGPITWDVAYLEIIGNTKLSMEILEKLDELSII